MLQVDKNMRGAGNQHPGYDTGTISDTGGRGGAVRKTRVPAGQRAMIA